MTRHDDTVDNFSHAMCKILKNSILYGDSIWLVEYVKKNSYNFILIIVDN